MGAGFKFIFGLFIIALLIFVGSLYFESFLTEKDLDIVITGRVKVINSSGNTRRLILTKNETFVNEDNSLFGKNDSEELQRKLIPGKKLRVRVVGYKMGICLPFHSEFRNIVKVVEKRHSIL